MKIKAGLEHISEKILAHTSRVAKEGLGGERSRDIAKYLSLLAMRVEHAFTAVDHARVVRSS